MGSNWRRISWSQACNRRVWQGGSPNLLRPNGHTWSALGRRQEKTGRTTWPNWATTLSRPYPDVSDSARHQNRALQTLPTDLRNHIDVYWSITQDWHSDLKPADKTDFAGLATMVNNNILFDSFNPWNPCLVSMVAANNDGYIINLSSTAGNYPYFGGSAYATKAFVTQF